MTGIVHQLCSDARRIAQAIYIGNVREIYLPPCIPQPDYDAEFGFVVLESGATGIFFTLLEGTLEALHRYPLDGLVGTSPVALLHGFESTDRASRALAAGALNAIAQSLFLQAEVEWEALDAIEWLAPKPDDAFGMVGYFPPLVRRLSAASIPLTVIEKNPDRVGRDGTVEVTLDAGRLRECNKVLITAATVLNNTVDEVLTQCAPGVPVALVGPTAGFTPDALFRRGVGLVGGTCVCNPEHLLSRVRAGEKWGDAATKYALVKSQFPDIHTLIERAQQRAGLAK